MSSLELHTKKLWTCTLFKKSIKVNFWPWDVSFPGVPAGLELLPALAVPQLSDISHPTGLAHISAWDAPCWGAELYSCSNSLVVWDMSLTCEVKIKRNVQDFSKQKKDDKSESKIKNPKLKPKSKVNKNCKQQKMSPLEKDTDNEGSPFRVAPKAS